MVAFNALTTETTFTPPSLRPKHGPSPENTQTLITLPSTPSPPPSPPPLRSSSSWTSPRRHQNEQDDEAQYPDREPLLSNQSNNSNSKQPRTRHGYTSSPQPQRSSSPSPWRNSFITGILSWIWVYIHNCYNRITVWLFPHEPEPLDLHSTIFFIAQVPMLILVAFTWIPCFVAWLLGIRTSQAGDRDKSQGMRRGWSARLALALSFLKCYLRYAERLTIEECQSRSRSIPFMTAPAGIRINKVKIPTFPYRSKAEAIVYDCLTDQERALLPHLNNGKTRDGKQEHELSVRVQQETDRDIDFIQNQYQKEQHSAQGHGQREDQFAEGLDAEWLEYIGPDEIGAETGADANKAAVLYFHGGGYYTGSKEEHRVLIGPLVKRLGKNVRIFIINYRLAPQYPFPAALIDALSSYMWLLDQSVSESFGQGPLNNSGSGSGVLHDRFQPNQIVFMGDSAGGGLALSLSLLLRDHGSLPQPLSIVAWSPWLDLTQALPSFKENAITDCIPYEDFTHSHSAVVDEMFSMQSQDVDVEEDGAYNAGPRIRQRAQVYCPDSCLRMKYVSPLFETDFSGIPSVFIVSSSLPSLCSNPSLLYPTCPIHRHKSLTRLESLVLDMRFS
ncbi:Alpha/Beta hydrolase protein [Gamsiella multidivaricata]|uniref:Alpha/Beta hydrolase protein n=1 Tax=Gamsiella multidivaricata TaxID=101098 RepID=UPI0022202155|nr:Alpha/Beta hydrolase protein [Gamsiella multidivaricata]KAI7825239.1 Alpha/Beta hydrolase protein [Gamsiella multidivaricata]